MKVIVLALVTLWVVRFVVRAVVNTAQINKVKRTLTHLPPSARREAAYRIVAERRGLRPGIDYFPGSDA